MCWFGAVASRSLVVTATIQEIVPAHNPPP